MISIEEAKQIIHQNTLSLQAEQLPLSEALMHVLSKDVEAQMDVPPFRQSSMDGYAFKFDTWRNEPLNITGVIQAGDANDYTVGHDAMKIFTGAKVPDDADTIVIVEHTNISDNKLCIDSPKLGKGANIRAKGSEINTGKIALEKGSIITPGAIALLASLGLSKVDVIKFPQVNIITTGDELQIQGNELLSGQVYESNSLAITAALKLFDIECKVLFAKDNVDDLSNAIKEALQQSDLVLLTGGVSAGDFDLVPATLESCGVIKKFHKLKQKPGKPLYFGMYQDRIPVFGLPGNPGSVLTCYYEYVTIALQILTGRNDMIKPAIHLPLKNSFAKPAGLHHYLKGIYNNNEVEWLDAQESYKMKSFAVANCLISIAETITEVKAGEMVEVHPIL